MPVAKRLNVLGLIVLVTSLSGCIEPTTSIRRTGGSTEVVRTAPAAPAPTTGPEHYTVQAGDTLFRIAFRYQTTVEDLTRWNGIADPNRIQVGQRLRIAPQYAAVATAPVAGSTPAQTTPAVQTDTVSSAPATTPSAPVSTAPVVQTAPDAPAQVGVPADALGATPGAPQRLPQVTTDTVDPRPVSPPSAPPPEIVVTTPTPPPTLDPEATLHAPPGAQEVTPVATAPAPTGKPPSAVRNGWSWPAAGRLIGTFVAADATRSGIDIAGTEGQAVYAAADGEVVYSGTGIIGYGELIVVQHANGLLSAYGHNRKRQVSEGASVKRGQQIAEMGRDASGRQLLHFEVRKSGKPVDPLAYLPGR